MNGSAIAAFDSGNPVSAASELRERYKDKAMIVAGYDDNRHENNPGGARRSILPQPSKVKEGAQRFTTARVAEKAGVSVGSLYQYFPNKPAILFRLQSDEWRQTTDLLRVILEDSGGDRSLRRSHGRYVLRLPQRPR